MTRLLIGLLIVGGGLALVERLVPLHREQKLFRPGWQVDLLHYVFNHYLVQAILVLCFLLALPLLGLLDPAPLKTAIRQAPTWQRVGFALLFTDLIAYWEHRLFHLIPWLWRFHAVHHMSERLDWLAAVRLHPINQGLSKALTALPLFWLGYSKADFGWYISAVTIWAFFLHANVRITFGPLKYLFATPHFHHWHHAADEEARNKNFAGQFPFWDWVFGTLHLPKDWPRCYGVQETLPDGYFGQMTWPFRRNSTEAVMMEVSHDRNTNER